MMRGKVNIDNSKPAPENQISPQPFIKPVRQPLPPLRNAVITDFKAIGNNGYSLMYAINNQKGQVNYNWINNLYNFTFTDINGNVTNATYQKRK